MLDRLQCELIVQQFGLAHISAGDLLRAEVAAGTQAGKRAKDFMDRGDLVPDEVRLRSTRACWSTLRTPCDTAENTSCCCQVVITMVKNRLAQPDAQTKGWLLVRAPSVRHQLVSTSCAELALTSSLLSQDGYPRSASQGAALEAAGIHPELFLLLEVPDDVLIQRVVGRRLDPVTGTIYHLRFAPPPPEIVPRLQQRSDDTEEKARNRLAVHERNVDAVRGMYANTVSVIDGNRDKQAVFADIQKAIAALR